MFGFELFSTNENICLNSMNVHAFILYPLYFSLFLVISSLAKLMTEDGENANPAPLP
jgi:hypothetical protein